MSHRSVRTLRRATALAAGAGVLASAVLTGALPASASSSSGPSASSSDGAADDDGGRGDEQDGREGQDDQSSDDQEHQSGDGQGEDAAGGSASDPSASPAPSKSAGGDGAGDGEGLAWAPPKLDHPITITVSARRHSLRLDDRKDYVIDMPDTPLKAVEGLTISGGNDVVLIGGEVQTRGRSGNRSGRGLYLKNQTGTVHVEGLRLSGPRPAEGIDLDQRKGATVQLENIAVDTVYGSYSGNHADVLQTWAGPDVLRVDRLEGSSTYQGFFLDPGKFSHRSPKGFDFRNVVLRDVGGKSAYLLWQSGSFPIATTDVTVVRNPRKAFPKQVLRSKSGSWSDVVEGRKDTPSPLTGEPGTDYVSPGYAGSPASQGPKAAARAAARAAASKAPSAAPTSRRSEDPSDS